MRSAAVSAIIGVDAAVFADKGLDRIQQQAVDEVESLGVPHPDKLLWLAVQMRPPSS